MFRIAFSVLLFVHCAQAQTILTLDTALREVLTDAPNLQASESQMRELHWKRNEALGQGFLPRLKANGNYLTDKKYMFINVPLNGNPVVFPNIFPNSQFNLMAELPLFDGWASTARLQGANRTQEAAQERFDWERFKTEVQVKLAFYQALAARQLRDVAFQNHKVLEDHKREAILFRKSGVSTNYDVLRVEVQYSNALTDLADAEDEITLATQRLAEVLGHEGENRDIQGELPIPQDSLIANQGKEISRADLRAMRLESLAREKEESASGRFWVPELSLFANYSFYNNLTTGLNDWDKYRNFRQVGFMMNWNLFDGGVSYSRAKQTIERKVQSEKQLKMAQLSAIKDLDLWTKRYLSQCRIYRARMEDIKRSEESVRLAKAGKKVGARTDSELLDAELDLFRSRAGAVKAQLGAVEAILHLQLASGRRYLE